MSVVRRARPAFPYELLSDTDERFGRAQNQDPVGAQSSGQSGELLATVSHIEIGRDIPTEDQIEHPGRCR